jgi:hypothetical protein
LGIGIHDAAVRRGGKNGAWYRSNGRRLKRNGQYNEHRQDKGGSERLVHGVESLSFSD